MVTVSILMPAHDAADTIAAAMRSVQDQTFSDWELIVINDASNDDTVERARQQAGSDARIRILDNDGPRGAAAARNAGLRRACGRYVAFLDADDNWLAVKLERQLSLLRQTGAPLCYAGFITRRAGRPDKVVNVPQSVSYEQLLAGNIIGCLTAIYDTEVCGKLPMPDLRRRHDYALWLMILKKHGAACGVSAPLAVLRLASGTLSANKFAATYDTWRMYRDVIGLSVWSSIHYLSRHLAQRIFR